MRRLLKRIGGPEIIALSAGLLTVLALAVNSDIAHALWSWTENLEITLVVP
jgi:hypothetical protein